MGDDGGDNGGEHACDDFSKVANFVHGLAEFPKKMDVGAELSFQLCLLNKR